MTTTHHTVRTDCRICPDNKQMIGRIDPRGQPRDTSLIPILDLGSTPLADKFVTNPEAKEASYPLRVGWCRHCSCVQLMDIVDDGLLFGNDYAFFTGASPSSIAYFRDYAAEMIERYPTKTRKVLEIASNDGTLLKHFQESGSTVLGVDPAGNTADVAIKAGVPTEKKLFSYDTSRHLKKRYGTYEMVIANNVLAHTDELHDFVAGVENMLDDEGVFIAEVQYLPRLLFPNAFDHVYHEHRSFFSLMALTELFRLHWMTIVDVHEADTQGGSIRVFVMKDPYRTRKVTQRTELMLGNERTLGIDRIETYQGMQARAYYTADKLGMLLEELKGQGKTIYGFGASAKGNTLLNYGDIGTDLLDCIVDQTPWKIGKFSPGKHIPVVAPGERPEPDYYLLLVHNYLPGILTREKAYQKKGGRFIVPIPVPIII